MLKWYRVSYDARPYGAIGIFFIHKFKFIEAYSGHQAYKDFYEWASDEKLECKVNFIEVIEKFKMLKPDEYLYKKEN